MPGHMRQLNIRIMPHPAMPIAPTKPGRFYPQDNTMFIRSWIWNVLDCWQFFEFIIDNCSHLATPQLK